MNQWTRDDDHVYRRTTSPRPWSWTDDLTTEPCKRFVASGNSTHSSLMSHIVVPNHEYILLQIIHLELKKSCSKPKIVDMWCCCCTRSRSSTTPQEEPITPTCHLTRRCQNPIPDTRRWTYQKIPMEVISGVPLTRASTKKYIAFFLPYPADPEKLNVDTIYLDLQLLHLNLDHHLTRR